jgi:hypothetical protein
MSVGWCNNNNNNNNNNNILPYLKPIQTWKELLSKRVPILVEGIACN